MSSAIKSEGVDALKSTLMSSFKDAEKWSLLFSFGGHFFWRLWIFGLLVASQTDADRQKYHYKESSWLCQWGREDQVVFLFRHLGLEAEVWLEVSGDPTQTRHDPDVLLELTVLWEDEGWERAKWADQVGECHSWGWQFGVCSSNCLQRFHRPVLVQGPQAPQLNSLALGEQREIVNLEHYKQFLAINTWKWWHKFGNNTL